MSNPEPKGDATPDNPSVVDDNKTPSVEEQLAIAEKRRKDTQAGYTKGQQTIKALEAEKAELIKQLEGAVKVTLSEEDQSRLDDLKYEDPEAWRKELNKLERKSEVETRANLEELTGEARKVAERNFELERREQVLKEYNEGAEIPITDEVITNDIPPRISKKLAEGTITFEEYLDECTEYLGKGKTVKNDSTLNQPNMSSMGGKTTPSNNQAEAPLSESYAKDIY